MRGNKGLVIGRTLLMAVGGLLLATAFVQAKDDYPPLSTSVCAALGRRGS